MNSLVKKGLIGLAGAAMAGVVGIFYKAVESYNNYADPSNVENVNAVKQHSHDVLEQGCNNAQEWAENSQALLDEVVTKITQTKPEDTTFDVGFKVGHIKPTISESLNAVSLPADTELHMADKTWIFRGENNAVSKSSDDVECSFSLENNNTPEHG